MKTRKRKKKMLPGQILVLGIICVILFGTLLLMLPVSSRSRSFTDFETAIFTATSATCVTGLSVVTTAEYWSLFGQCVILFLIQIGGLGFMSMAVLVLVLLKRNVTPYENLIVAQAFSLSKIEDAASSFMKRILTGTLSFEACGAILLSTRFIPKYGFWDGLFKSVFHSVSAFCNAGFDLIGENSLLPFRNDYVVMLTISLLIIIGGIGFIVWDDIRDKLIRKKRIMPYTKIVLLTSLILLVIGTAATAYLEWDNALAGLNYGEKICSAFFHSASLRTAGFAVFNNAEIGDAMKVISMVLMFIGGASGSTAGGIKVSTIAILVYTAVKSASGRDEIIMFKRKIPHQIILRAMSLVVCGIVFVSVPALIISQTETGASLMQALFETISAYATVGLTLGITQTVGSLSHYLLILLMFMGRVGFFTITFSLMMRSAQKKSVISYPEAQIMIG